MAKPFGQADTGLLKYTQLGESALAMDEGLMRSNMVSTALSTFSSQQQQLAQQGKELEKEIEKNFKTATGNPDQQAMNILYDMTPKMKNMFVKNKGGDVNSRQNRQFAMDNYNGIIDQVDNITGLLQVSRDSSVYGEGMSSLDIYNANSIASGNYVMGTRQNKSTGYDDVYVGVPKMMAPEKGADIIALEKADYNSLDEGDKKKLDEYRNLENKYTEWNALPDYKSGTKEYNPDKYNIFGSNDLPIRGGSEEMKTAQLGAWNNNFADLKSDSDYKKQTSNSSYGQDFRSELLKKKPNYSERMDMVFGDFSDDGVEIQVRKNGKDTNVPNTFANLFIYEAANPDKHPDLYKDADGNNLVFKVFDPDSQTYSNIEHGSDEWKANYTDKERQLILENYLRGHNTDGSVDTEKNKEWLIDRYSNFMGVVKKDAFEIKKRNHFEAKGMYFNSGDREQAVFTNSDDAYASKELAYNNALVDIAFPQKLLGNKEELEKMLDKGGSIAKALKREFKGHENVEFDFKDDNELRVNIDGEDFTFDFSGKKKNKSAASELERLKKELSRATADELDLKKMSNSVEDDDWSELNNRLYDYHPSLEPKENVNVESFDARALIPGTDAYNEAQKRKQEQEAQRTDYVTL